MFRDLWLQRSSLFWWFGLVWFGKETRLEINNICSVSVRPQRRHQQDDRSSICLPSTSGDSKPSLRIVDSEMCVIHKSGQVDSQHWTNRFSLAQAAQWKSKSIFSSNRPLALFNWRVSVWFHCKLPPSVTLCVILALPVCQGYSYINYLIACPDRPQLCWLRCSSNTCG